MIKRKRNRISKPHFNLRDRRLPKLPTPIFLFYQYNPDKPRLKYSIGESVIPEYWDQKHQRAIVKALHPEYGDLNDRLAKIILKAKETAKNNPSIDHDDFKAELDQFLGIREKPKERLHPSLFEFIQALVDHERNKVDAKSTWKKINSLLNHLKAYANEKGLGELEYDDIDWDFKQSFENWCYSPPRNHSQNNMNKNFEVLSGIMREAYNRHYVNQEGIRCRYHNNEIPLDKKFGVNRVKTSHHPLSLSELRLLLAFNDLTDTETKVKDLFLMSAFGGGFRFSDYRKVKKENIYIEDGVEMLRMHTTKGDSKKFDNEVVIPVLPEFKQLLEKYNYNPPLPLSSQKSNVIIKRVCEKAGLKRLVEVKESKSGKVVLSHAPLWTQVSSHISRYSFITFMLNELLASPAEVALMTGQSLKVMFEYSQADKAKSAIRFAKRKIQPDTKQVTLAKTA